MADKNEIRQRIAALLAKTAASGATPGEQAAAAAKADELIRRYGFSRAEFEPGAVMAASGGAAVAPEPAGSSRRWLTLIPIVLFVALAAVFLIRIIEVGTDTSFIPSALIGQKAPEFDLPPLTGATAAGTPVPGLSRADLATGEVTVVNIWASWCGPCRLEHPFLEALTQDNRFRLAGINYKDQQANALDFLTTEGNPFDAIGVDASGRTGIDFGVYGVPETFVIGRDGTILYKFVGPITSEAALRDRLMPEIEKALAAPPATPVAAVEAEPAG